MSMLETAERHSPTPAGVEHANVPETVEYIKINNPKIVEAFWASRAIIGLSSKKEAAQRRLQSVLPVIKFELTTDDENRQFKIAEGPDVRELILDEESLGKLKLSRWKYVDTDLKNKLREFGEILKSHVHSMPFWEIPGRDDPEYRKARIDHELPVAIRAIKSDPDIKLPEDKVEDYARKIIESLLGSRQELIIPDTAQKGKECEKPEKTTHKTSSGTTDIMKVINDETIIEFNAVQRSAVEGEPINRPKRKRKKIVAVLTAGTAISLMGANEIGKFVPDARVSTVVKSIGSDKRSFIGNFNSPGLVVLENDENGVPKSATVTNSENGPKNNIGSRNEKDPKIKAAEESIASAAFLIETVKNKKEVIAAKAVKYNIPERFLGTFVMLRSGGNSKAGDSPGNDTKGLLLISEAMAAQEIKNIQGNEKYDLLNDSDNLEIGASRLAALIKKYGGLDTNEQIAGIAQEFIGVKTEVPAFLSGIWLQQKQNDFTAFNLWVNSNVVAINNARLSQGLNT